MTTGCPDLSTPSDVLSRLVRHHGVVTICKDRGWASRVEKHTSNVSGIIREGRKVCCQFHDKTAEGILTAEKDYDTGSII